MKELLEQLRSDGYPGCRPRVQAKAALIAIGGTVVVAWPVEALAEQPEQSLSKLFGVLKTSIQENG